VFIILGLSERRLKGVGVTEKSSLR